MQEKLEAIKENALSEMRAAASKVELENIRVKYLGKKMKLPEF